jgi:hypothetical protein
VASVETPDASTVVVKLKSPVSAFLDYMAAPYGPKIVSPTLVKAHEVDGDLAQEYLQTHDAGTGPYTISIDLQDSGNSGFLGDDFIDFSVSNDGDVRVADFDQSPAVPEPTSLVLWCGLGALALKRWRTAVSW